MTYQLTVRNHGPDDVDMANVVDDLPSGVSYVSDTDSCVPAGTDPERLHCTVGPIVAGDESVFFVTARLDADLATGTALVNFGSVTVPGGFDDDPSNNSDDDSSTVVKRADLRVSKVASESTPASGTQLVYTIEAENLGPSDVTGVTVVDDLPPEVDFVSTSRPDICQLFGTEVVSCFVDALDAGQTVQIQITVDIPADVAPGTRLDNRVEIESATDDPNPANNVDEEDVLVVSRADLWLEKEARPDPVTAGERLTYTLTVHNDGPSDVPAIEVVDILSSDVAYAGASGAACSGVPIGASGVLTCDVGPLAAGAMASFEIFVDVDPGLPDGATVSNSAVVNGPRLDRSRSEQRRRRGDSRRRHRGGPSGDQVLAGRGLPWHGVRLDGHHRQRRPQRRGQRHGQRRHPHRNDLRLCLRRGLRRRGAGRHGHLGVRRGHGAGGGSGGLHDPSARGGWRDGRSGHHQHGDGEQLDAGSRTCWTMTTRTRPRYAAAPTWRSSRMRSGRRWPAPS